MKKHWITVIFLSILLTGCVSEPVFEPVTDDYVIPEAAASQIVIALPEDASVTVLTSSENGQLYLCDGYTITVQTLESGDLDSTLRTLTGFGEAELTLMQTQQQGMTCIEAAWTSAGEGGDQVGRLLMLDDGDYYYAVTIMAPAEDAGVLNGTWQEIFNSITLEDTDS